MFSILIEEQHAGPLRRLFGRPRVEIRTLKKLRFAVVSVPDLERADFTKLRRLLGRTAGSLVLPQGAELPADCGLSTVDTAPYAHAVLRATLDYLFRQSRLPLREVSSVLVDPAGKWIEYAKVLIKYSGRLKVVTAAAGLYEDFSRRMLEEYGAVASVEDTLENPNRCRLIVAPCGLEELCAEEVRVPVVSLSDCGALHGYHTFRSPPPPLYGELMPQGADAFAYQAALYSLCHATALGKIPAAVCRYQGREITVNEMAADILHGPREQPDTPRTGAF